jgi:hypothetical protein
VNEGEGGGYEQRRKNEFSSRKTTFVQSCKHDGLSEIEYYSYRAKGV